MLSKFHEGALGMLSLEYRPDGAAHAALKRREAELAARLPPSFVEWFGMTNGIELLEAHSNDDDPFAIAGLGSPIQWQWAEARDCVRDGLLPFMAENQGCCLWAVSLDGSDDPPVLVIRDPKAAWQACAQSFSSFIDCQIWDHTAVFTVRKDQRVLLQAQDHPLRARDLAFLRERFTERTTTRGWPGDSQYRFESREGCLLLWDSPDQTDWWVASAREGDLMRLTQRIWQLGDLRSSLWSNDARGHELLKRLRA